MQVILLLASVTDSLAHTLIAPLALRREASPGNDKTMHLIAYAVLAFPVSIIKPKKYIYYLLFYGIWSGIIEIFQPYVNRYGEWEDLYANCTGLFLGYVVGLLLSKLFPNKNDIQK